jgi:hypothetical protein
VRLAVTGNIPRAAFDDALAKLSQLLRNPPGDLAV